MSKRRRGQTDDDGWGEAAENATATNEEATTGSPQNDWDDPANLAERLAALHEERELPHTAEEQSEGIEEKSLEDISPGDKTPTLEAQEINSPGDSSVPESLVVSLQSGEHSHNAMNSEISVTDEDAPQWSADDELPSLSSDMLAAAEVISEIEADPKQQKKRARNQKKDRSGLTRKQELSVIAGALMLIFVGVCAVLGWLNSKNFYLVCGTQNSITAEQGRLWPWGQAQLEGKAFRAILVPDDVVCQNSQFDNQPDLERAFLAMLLQQSTILLKSGDPPSVTEAEAQLEQALLLTRTPQRAPQREQAQRLYGDVSYWRGAADMKRAVKILETSAEQFDNAAEKRAQQSGDIARAWADHARGIAAEINKGPVPLRSDEHPKDAPEFEDIGSLGADEQPPAMTPQDDQLDTALPTTNKPQFKPVQGVAPIHNTQDNRDAGSESEANKPLPTGGVLL